MAYYDFPHTRNYDTDLGYLIQHINDWDDELAKKADKDWVQEQLALKVDEVTYLEDMAALHDEVDAKVDKDVYNVKMNEIAGEIQAKQDLLVSGTNIKTINNESILGEGNIDITGASVDIIDNHNSTRTDAALSANMGREIYADLVAAQQECHEYTTYHVGVETTNRELAITVSETKTLNAAKAYVDEQITTALNASY